MFLLYVNTQSQFYQLIDDVDFFICSLLISLSETAPLVVPLVLITIIISTVNRINLSNKRISLFPIKYFIKKNKKSTEFIKLLFSARSFANQNFEEKKERKKEVFFTLNLLELSEKLFFSLIFILNNPFYSFKVTSSGFKKEKFNFFQSFFSLVSLVTLYLF